jgi:hypothetical protein
MNLKLEGHHGAIMKKKPVLRQLTVLVLAADHVELTAVAVERGLCPAQL